MQGIYIAYLSGAEGYSALLFVLRNGRLTGADAGGGTYSGAYETTNDTLIGTIVVNLYQSAVRQTHAGDSKAEESLNQWRLAFGGHGDGIGDRLTG